VRAAARRLADYPHLGHFNTWQIDKLQILIEKNHGRLLYPAWVNASDYQDTAESFVTVALHSKELADALEEQAKKIPDKVKNSFSADLRFQCRAMGVPIPILPVDGEDEYKLFLHLLLNELKQFDADEMAMEWVKHVDGVSVFPKLPFQLRHYHKHWERNWQVQSAVESMQSEIEMLTSSTRSRLQLRLWQGAMVLH